MHQPLIPFDVPVEGEPETSWEYFQHYRDLGPGRTKVQLADLEIDGKTRTVGQIGKWAKKFRWDFRAHAYDMAEMQRAHEEIILQREDSIADFINEEINFASQMQRIAKKMAKNLEDALDRGEPVAYQEYRSIAWGYREARTWVKDLLAFTYGDGRTPEHHRGNHS